MYARRTVGAGGRRGVVLILILGMLGLLSLIGVTFVAFSGQAQIGASYAAQAVHTPPPEQVIDFALDQLINDTGNPASAIRGHSLKRDMYGNDARRNFYLTGLPEPINQPLMVTGVTQSPSSVTDRIPFVITTNIPTNSNSGIGLLPQLYNANFVGCTLRLSQWLVYNDGNFTKAQQVQRPDRLAQTFEIVADDATSGIYHSFMLTFADVRTTVTNLDGTPSTVQEFVQPNSGTPGGFTIPSGYSLANLFEIDGRYRRAFNGTGLDRVAAIDDYGNNRPYSAYGNFLYNALNAANYPSGYNDPNFLPYHMDEDFDAADNDNWFLSLRSADGSLVMPSFHRPGNIIYNPNNTAQDDWSSKTPSARSKFLRPRQIDHPQSAGTFPDLKPNASPYLPDGVTPNPKFGRIDYDVDNDGDGVTDSVWLDLGYPVQRDSTGKPFKPLFAFMVQGLNGKLPLNTAGNLNKVKYDYASGVTAHVPEHASHIGYSVNEINPEFALTPTGTAAPAGGQPYLQVLLQGNMGNPTATPPVPPTEGRFGEVDLIKASLASGSNPPTYPRAGRSFLPNGNYSSNSTYPKQDMFDIDYNGTDFYPGTTNPPALTPTIAESPPTPTSLTADLLDPANRVLLPSERIRRFLTPIDLSGSGRMMHFDALPYGEFDWGLGGDIRGRVSHFLYFRPPGISNWPGDNIPPASDMTRTLADNTINKLHGYESFRNPISTTPAGTNRYFMAPAPWDLNNGMRLPTFTTSINSYSPADYPAMTPLNGVLIGGGLALQEASQLNLYEKTSYDSPFSIADQEWLDRKGDVDDTGLSVRLANLLPDVLVTDVNASIRRKMLTTDSWDLGAWAAPVATMGTQFGVPRANTVLSDGNPQQFDNVANLPSLMHGARRINLNLPLPVSDDPFETTRQKWCRDTYQMMKCVLFPPDGARLPNGNPVPAETLAAIGQYAVNIIDFRDPDATMTGFVNYDLIEQPATIATVSGGLLNFQAPAPPPAPAITVPAGVARFTGAPPNASPVVQWGMEFNPVAITEIAGYQYTRKDTASNSDRTTPRLFIELVNMLTRDQGLNADGRACELDLNGWGFIITQDDPSITTATTPPVAAAERPNRITGQLRQSTIDNYFVPLAGGGMGLTATPAPLANHLMPLDPAGGTPEDYYVFGNYINGAPPVQTAASPGPPAVPITYNYPNVEQNTPAIDAQLSDQLVSQIPETAMTPAAASALAAKDRGKFYWLHLLRPANPKDPSSPKVVVDSFRFPYFVDSGKVAHPDANNDTVTVGTNALYSARRLQPNRGGHFVPYSETYPNAPNPYGYSEQTFPTQTQNSNPANTPMLTTTALYNKLVMGVATPTRISGNIYHSLDKRNSGSENWDVFPFHDRDFQSVAELLLVPACPPGLFTKQFVEYPNPTPYNVDPTTRTFTGILPPTAAQLNRAGLDNLKYAYPPPWDKTSDVGLASDALTVPSATLPLTGYNGGGIPPTLSQYTFSAIGLAGYPSANMPDPCAFPYLPEAFYYSTGSRSGWYKLMEFFEVPSTSFGYIGPAASGQNSDWLRRDTRPGLMNLNLITDEEAFFGLMDDLRMNPASVTAEALRRQGLDASLPIPNLPPPGTPTTYPIGAMGLPLMATAVYPNGMPSFTASMADRGFRYVNGTLVVTGMKAAFADFLKLRDGGSGLVYSPFSTSPFTPIWGDPTNSVALPSRPYRSLANQFLYTSLPTSLPTDFQLNIDVNDTIMRPARLPAFQYASGHNDQAQRVDLVTNPFTKASSPPAGQPAYLAASPRIAPRRLFQIPDADIATAGPILTNAGFDPTKFPYGPYGTPNASHNPASEVVSPNFDPFVSMPPVPPPPVFTPGWNPGDEPFLTNTNPSLFFNTSMTIPTVSGPPPPPRQGYLGGSSYTGIQDHRWHPMFRTEMLSKVMNQTTTRTHQYSVWLTVGFFEVVKEGNPQLYNQYDPVTGNSMALDQLGRELNADVGKNVRYRSYFLLDRTRAAGFNPFEPGDFRDLIVFRRRIE